MDTAAACIAFTLSTLVLGCGGRPAPVEPTTPREDEPVGVPPDEGPAVDAAVDDTTDPAADDEPAPPPRLLCIVDAYPDAVTRAFVRDGAWRVVFADGRESVWNDGRDKTPEERLDEPDLEDMMAESYPAGRDPGPVGEDVEPGRVRVSMLFDNAYGGSERVVRADLVEIPWPGGGHVRMSSRNGAADALRRVIASLDGLDEAARACLAPRIGSFSYRQIRGTERLSPHAYGIAIDLNVGCGEYWRWQEPFEGEWRNRMPRAVVDAFEAQGFAWGGRWYHYDTFHFEYRPELFVPACRGGD